MLHLALSTGCPCGVGPEVALAALALGVEGARVSLHGDPGALADAALRLGLDLAALPFVTVRPASELAPADRVPGAPTEASGAAQLRALDQALDEVLAGRADALVTGPVSKLAITRSGVTFHGHTEHLARRSGAAPVVMLFAGPRLRTALVTTHRPLREVPDAVTREAVRDTVILTARALLEDFGLARPALAVAGVNPHAGEGGLLGAEEMDTVAPALEDARAALGDTVRMEGPIAAEAAFRRCRDGAFDAVVAMYHDQATIASKLLDFGAAVNVTLGLPFVRTSVDHGTAYDIAGRARADPGGMVAALDLAVRLARRRRARQETR